jgi:hypothetical protein
MWGKQEPAGFEAPSFKGNHNQQALAEGVPTS